MPLSQRWRHRVLQTMLLGSLLYMICTLGWISSRRTPSPEQIQAEAHARTVRNLPRGDVQRRNLTCIGWRATADCTPDGPRQVAQDLPCHAIVPSGTSGYCEVQDVDTSERFRVMRRTCSRYKDSSVFQCSDAPDFVQYRIDTLEAVERALAPTFSLPNIHTKNHPAGQDGIVMVVYPGLLHSAYAIIRTLRDVLGCQLPLELWYREDEVRHVPNALWSFQQLAQKDAAGGLTLRAIPDARATRFRAKIFALYHSAFDRVLFLDSDNVPVRDPTYLFHAREFETTGAVFWPDYWHPRYTVFLLWDESLLWELLDMSYVDMFEQESGQLLIDRRQHAAPLALVHFWSFRTPNPMEKLRLLYGDKDLFRFAWMKLNVPFYMIQTPPAVAGTINGSSFCGMTMVQHDAHGNVLFLHRNARKLTGDVRYKPESVDDVTQRITSNLIQQGLNRLPSAAEVAVELQRMEKTRPDILETPREPDGMPDRIIWTHLLTFGKNRLCSEYRIEPFIAPPDFPRAQRCYGERDLARNVCFHVQLFADLPFAGLETHVRRFAFEAAQRSRGEHLVVTK